MDSLDNLPLKEDTNPNSHEEEIMSKFFTPPGQNPSPPRGPPRGAPQNTAPGKADAPEPEGINWKLIGYTTLLFVALANPWLDTLLCKIPYCGDNAFTLLGMKVLTFALLYVIVTVYFG